MSTHPAFSPGSVAVVTGGASGIGLAAACRFAGLGLRVAIADRPGPALEAAVREVAAAGAGASGTATGIATDVSRLDEVERLAETVGAKLGPPSVVMNNAGIQPGSALFGPVSNWETVIGVNLWGVIHGSRVFGAEMAASGRPGIIINTGSKQGITTPPGDPAYNVSKAGVKAFTEALQHELRTREGCRTTAHLLIPGFVFTPLTANGRTEKPAGAWTPGQTVEFMMESIGRGDFYILCPDNEVDRRTDERRMAWAMGDLIENRPPLSRWHPGYGDAFKAFLAS